MLNLIEPKAPGGSEEGADVDISAIKFLKRCSSDAPPPTLEHKFKRGDEATVAKKMTWKIPSKTDPEYRKDIMPGTKGTIEGFNDSEGRQVLFKCIVSLEDCNKTITRAVSPQNLMHTEEYLLSKASSSAAASDGGPPTNKRRRPMRFQSGPWDRVPSRRSSRSKVDPRWTSPGRTHCPRCGTSRVASA